MQQANSHLSAVCLPPRHVRDLPTVIYFHENQLTYPVRFESERDYQFAVTNVTSALAADAVWFNSGFHRDAFLDALDTFLRRMPDYQPTDAPAKIRQKALVCPPGVRRMPDRGARHPGSLRILWAARWEHDKSPEDFFAALRILEAHRVQFRISTVGAQFRESPEVFSRAHREFAEHVDRWGYQEDRTQYEGVLREADVFVSTAQHEFFGLSAVEATLAGAYPLLPKRLAYPEVFSLDDDEAMAQFFYDGSVEVLADRLAELAAFVSGSPSLSDRTESLRHRLSRFEWSNLAPVLDNAIQQIANHK